MKLYRSMLFVPGNRPEWIDKAPQYKPDALIVDLVMPGLTGFDVLDALRARPAFAQLPVFVWTSKIGRAHV